jgi:hypothetical protein
MQNRNPVVFILSIFHHTIREWEIVPSGSEWEVGSCWLVDVEIDKFLQIGGHLSLIQCKRSIKDIYTNMG